RQGLDPRARREDHVRGLEDALAALAGRAVLAGLADADLVRPVAAAATLDPRHLVLRDQRLHAGPHALDDGIASGGELGVVDLRLTGQVQAEVLGMPDTVGECSRLEQGLGRDAPAMEACAADLV